MDLPLVEEPPPERGVFANRTLNLRAVRTIGYDMDYTLIHYHVNEWEDAAFRHAARLLADRGWPVSNLEFEPSRFTLGLVFDLELGNLLKATRFGYVTRTQHGSALLGFDRQRRMYRNTVVDLSEDRYEFMNTMFELSRAALWTQLVEIHDREPLPEVHSYRDLYRGIDEALNESHTAGALKAEILADPDRFIELDPQVVATLQEQRRAGKKLLLITNSDWFYTRQIMAYAIDPFCPRGNNWRDLFDIVIVSANKPRFFAHSDPIYRVVDEANALLKPHFGPLEAGDVYFGGNALMVERSLGDDDTQPLYVGDHLFGDVHVTKDVLRWRTALVARELEPEIRAARAFAPEERRLVALMERKTRLERSLAQHRMILVGAPEGSETRSEANRQVEELTAELIEVDREIAPLARMAATLGNPHWGPLMRAGNDKSLFARQVERYADVYTSRVSNFRFETPFAYLRAAHGSLPHDQTPA